MPSMYSNEVKAVELIKVVYTWSSTSRDNGAQIRSTKTMLHDGTFLFEISMWASKLRFIGTRWISGYR